MPFRGKWQADCVSTLREAAGHRGRRTCSSHMGRSLECAA